MISRRACVAAVALLAAGAARAQATAPAELAAELPGARLQGQGRLTFFGLQVYDARLWAGSGAVPAAGDWAGVPCALEIVYARALKGEQIAERSMSEMRRQRAIDEPTAERWLGAMKRVFPDVKVGDRLAGINLPGTGARFLVNGALRGEVREVEFARLFFGIWLAPGTSEPALREALLGAARS